MTANGTPMTLDFPAEIYQLHDTASPDAPRQEKRL